MNLRLYDQYARMLLLVWMGATFEGDALVRWRRLRSVYGLAQLGITVDTVKDHKKRIRERLEARNSSHAVALAYEYGVWA